MDNYNKNLSTGKPEQYQFTARVYKLKVTFARHGISQRIISDDEPQLSSKEFPHPAETWNFEDTHSRSMLPQSPLLEGSGRNLKE